MAVGWGEAECTCYAENALEIEADRGTGLLGNFVFDGQIEVIGTVREPFKGTLVLGKDRSPNVGNVVEEDTAERKMAQVLTGSDLDTANLCEVGLIRPT